ncbi:MAG: hypothetical protein ACI8RD_013485 [Bacillariaceae sp.]|jgi:hypothetical protein
MNQSNFCIIFCENNITCLTAFVDFFDFDTSNNPTVNFLKTHGKRTNASTVYRIKKQSHGGLRNKKNKRERHMPSFTLEREKTVTSKNKQSTLVIVRVTPVKHKSSLDKKNYVYRA